jgi:putative RNA 2'-phosphotransferase
LGALTVIVASGDKARFEFDSDKHCIRVRHGHSVDVVLTLDPCEPPEHLYHGTVARFIKSIQGGGLQSRGRQFVHLSSERKAAHTIGAKRAKPVILAVRSRDMFAGGFEFHLSTSDIC